MIVTVTWISYWTCNHNPIFVTTVLEVFQSNCLETQAPTPERLYFYHGPPLEHVLMDLTMDTVTMVAWILSILSVTGGTDLVSIQ